MVCCLRVLKKLKTEAQQGAEAGGDRMNVLSLFDGMSCGRQALERANIKVDKYYASEIDKYAIQVTQHNYPDTIQVGSVTEVDVSNLDPIDLLIGGSPCQSFSFAGKRNGMTTSCNEEIYTLDRYLELKQDGFQFEGESYLFWEYMRILTDIRKYNPDVLFLLENVEMGAKWERVLSEAIGIYGVHINSALVSAQNRKRIYWTNIRTKEEGLFGELHSDIPQPGDRGILLKDILEDEVDEKYYLSDKASAYLNRDEMNKRFMQSYNDDKSICVTANFHKGIPYNVLTDRDKSNCIIKEQRKNIQQLEPRQDGKTNTLTSVQKDNLVMQLNPSKESGGKAPYQHNRIYSTDGISPCLNTDARSPAILIPEATAKGYVEIEPGECFDAENINSETRRGRKMKDESNCLMAKETDFMLYEGVDFRKNYAVVGGGYEQDNRAYYENGKSGTLDLKSESRQKVLMNNARIRRLTPVECERLQTVNDNYSSCVSDSQRYKMLGNGWTVDVIAHIFSFIDEIEKI